MSTYKVIQDIEAEDHILGPFSFRQFVYLLIAIFFLYIDFIALTKNIPIILIFFTPPALFFGFLAFPFIKDQPTEVWALAKIRFLVKPHKRVWTQSEIQEIVTITAPKQEEKQLTDGLNQNEIKSRLKILSETIDSRGWAVKNSTQNIDNSDRLITQSFIPQNVPEYVSAPSEDMLDEDSNPVAYRMNDFINQSTKLHRDQLVSLMNQPSPTPPTDTVLIQPTPALTDEEINQQLKKNALAKKEALASLQILNNIPKVKTEIKSTPQVNPVIINLSQNNDLNLSTLSKVANKNNFEEEVVISLR